MNLVKRIPVILVALIVFIFLIVTLPLGYLVLKLEKEVNTIKPVTVVMPSPTMVASPSATVTPTKATVRVLAPAKAATSPAVLK